MRINWRNSMKLNIASKTLKCCIYIAFCLLISAPLLADVNTNVFEFSYQPDHVLAMKLPLHEDHCHGGSCPTPVAVSVPCNTNIFVYQDRMPTKQNVSYRTEYEEHTRKVREWVPVDREEKVVVPRTIKTTVTEVDVTPRACPTRACPQVRSYPKRTVSTEYVPVKTRTVRRTGGWWPGKLLGVRQPVRYRTRSFVDN